MYGTGLIHESAIEDIVYKLNVTRSLLAIERNSTKDMDITRLATRTNNSLYNLAYN